MGKEGEIARRERARLLWEKGKHSNCPETGSPVKMAEGRHRGHDLPSLALS